MTDDGMKYPATKFPFSSTPLATATPIAADWFTTGPPELPKSRRASVRIHPAIVVGITDPDVTRMLMDDETEPRYGYPTIHNGSSSSGSGANPSVS